MRKIMFNDKYGLTIAVLEGRKTMTRRIIRSPKKMDGEDVNGFVIVTSPGSDEIFEVMALNEEGAMINNILPKYKVGEVVAVAQKYSEIYNHNFAFDFGLDLMPGWKNKMFVPAAECKHRIRITNIHIERLQDISEEDCFREGVDVAFQNGHAVSYYRFENSRGHYYTPREAFAGLIDKVSGKGTWERNPWVFVYEFELIK